MAEYDYLEEEIELSGPLIPCEFCFEPFPLSVYMEHATACNAELFRGSGEPDDVPQVTSQPQKDLTELGPKVRQVTSQPLKDLIQLGPKVNESSSIKIEQLITNTVFDFQHKNDKGPVLQNVSDLTSDSSFESDKSSPCIPVLQNVSDLTSDSSFETDKSSPCIHFKTHIDEQDESESEDEDLPSDVKSDQVESSFLPLVDNKLHIDSEDSVEFSDDNNEENETIESFLLKASLELHKIKRALSGARPKYTSFGDQEEATYHQSQLFYNQNCY